MNKNDYKYIGFKLVGEKEIIFDVMLQALTDFTMFKSYCRLYFKNKKGKLYVKSYRKKTSTKFYINGFVK